MRSGLVKAHRYLALTVGIFFVFLGLTGSILAFYPELDRALNPKLDIPHSEKRQSLETVLGNAKKVFPDKFLHSIFWASEDQPFHQVWFTPSGDDQSLMWEVMVHPSTAEVIGHRQAVPTYDFTRTNFVNTIYTLHLLMFVGPLSFIFLGLCGFLVVLTLAIGVWLWWPTPKSLLLSLTIKRGASSFRRAFDLHRVFGIYSLIFLFIVSVTGIYLALPVQIESLLGVNNETSMASVEVSPTNVEVHDLDSLLSHASTLVNAQHKLKSVWMPSETSSYWRVTFRDPVHIGYAGSDVIFLFDAQTGALLKSSNYETDSGIKQALRWQHPIHSGRAFGFWGRAAVFVSGFVPLVLLITGFLIWRRKRGVLQRGSYKEVG